ncbi:MAG: hypothetical protein ACYC4I_00320 [Minisyncoccota bacterium]
MFVLLLPFGLLLLAWYPSTSAWVNALEALGLPIVLTALLSQLGRDLGKKKEPALFAEWGGMPTDRTLSFGKTFLDGATFARYRAKLVTLLPSVQFLDEAQELAAPDAALQVFRTCTNFLREKTRDHGKFPLIFAENINYGFRRNLWAMRAAGMTISVIGTIGAAAPILLMPGNPISALEVAAVVINACLFVFWLLRINKDWVRVTAEEYAKQLFAACEVL